MHARRATRPLLWLALTLAALAPLTGRAAPDPAASDDTLVTELATDHVDITTHFTGEKILVFGAISRPGDIVIKVKSPTETVALTRKVQMGPFWLANGKIKVSNAPGLLYLLSTEPLDKLLPAAERDRYGLALKDALQDAKTDAKPKGMGDWQAAFMRLKADEDHYVEGRHAVRMDSKRLFFTSINLPAKIPLGVYHLEFYLVRDGKVVAQQTRKLNVQQVRIERWMSNTAHETPWGFGIVYTLGAMFLGLVLGVVLQRDRDD
ncbi:MAG: TIGR02186 family protein [Gammaproteobacteria bacterium]